MTNNTYERNSVNFAGILTVLFIGLKLTNFIDWSWWWVLSPLCIPIAFVPGTLCVIGFIQLTLNINKFLLGYWCFSSVLKSKLKSSYKKFREL